MNNNNLSNHPSESTLIRSVHSSTLRLVCTAVTRCQFKTARSQHRNVALNEAQSLGNIWYCNYFKAFENWDTAADIGTKITIFAVYAAKYKYLYFLKGSCFYLIFFIYLLSHKETLLWLSRSVREARMERKHAHLGQDFHWGSQRFIKNSKNNRLWFFLKKPKILN